MRQNGPDWWRHATVAERAWRATIQDRLDVYFSGWWGLPGRHSAWLSMPAWEGPDDTFAIQRAARCVVATPLALDRLAVGAATVGDGCRCRISAKVFPLVR